MHQHDAIKLRVKHAVRINIILKRDRMCKHHLPGGPAKQGSLLVRTPSGGTV
jgi:hypothetical protein